MKRVLVTGGAGFIGTHFVRRYLACRPEHQLVVLDKLTYAGRRENLVGLEDSYPGYRFLRGDVAEPADVEAAFDLFGGVDIVVHLAAESHVDRSIEDAAPFVRTNVLGTQVLLEAARRRGVSRFLHVSTDEVYGSLGPAEPPWSEDAPLRPSSPYAASKAGADCLALAYFTTYGVPVIITRSSNNYGPYQFAEKLVPRFITLALRGQPLPLYGDGKNVRDWIHVHDHSDALQAILAHGRPGQTYNIEGRCARENVAVARAICRATSRHESLIQPVADRPGHDRRYAVDAGKLTREIGWRPGPPIEDRIIDLVRWYDRNRPFWDGSVAVSG